MSVIISPIITNAGLGVFTPMTTGIEFTFTHVAVGTGTSAVTAAATALENEIARFPIAGGGIVTGGQAVSINALITNHANANPQDYDITEFGFYGVDGNSNTVLFAIYRTNTTIVRKVSGADISAPFVMGLAALPTNNMTVQIDTNTSQTLALMGQHTAANHPHTQYKRTLDNTERLKIATAVDADDAIRKDELDALRLRLIANGIDADLVVTNNATGLDFNDDEFKVAGVWYFDHAINTSTENTSGIITVKQVGNKAYQHEILDNGQAANRVFTGVQWLPWVYQTGAVQGVVTFIPIDDYADLNDFNTAGYFTFSTSDNVGHAPPTYGLESDYEMEVLLSGGNLIQIVKNITTNSGFIRIKESGSWPSTWTLTPQIQHIVTNADIDNIRSEGVYLCTKYTNDGLPDNGVSPDDVFILQVKNSETLLTVVQVALKLNSTTGGGVNRTSELYARSIIDDGSSFFSLWYPYVNNEHVYEHSLDLTHYLRIGNWLNAFFDETIFTNTSSNPNTHLETLMSLSSYEDNLFLRSYNLNNAWSEGVYIFTLNDNIENIPSVFTDENHFFMLISIDTNDPYSSSIPEHRTQVIFQMHSKGIVSDIYIRTQLLTDWQNHVTPPAWVLVP